MPSSINLTRYECRFLYKRRKLDRFSTDDKLHVLAQNDLLVALSNILNEHGRTNADCGIEMPNEDLDNSAFDNSSQIDEGAKDFFDSNFQSLTDEQQTLFYRLMEHIETVEGGLYSLDTPAGAGKTFFCDVFLAAIRKDRIIAISTAMSGIAATLLRLATTFHRRFGAPIPCTENSCSKLKLNSNEAQIIREAAVIVVDEVSMMDYKLLDMLDRFLQELMQKHKFMGDKLILLMHDFRQTLPVIEGGNRPRVVSSAVMNSELWQHFIPLHLTRNMRIERLLTDSTSEARKQRLLHHKDWLLSIGNGTAPPVVPNTNIIEIPKHMVANSKTELESRIFPDFVQNHTNVQYLSERAIVSTKNGIVQQCNFEMIEQLPGDMEISCSRDSCIDPDSIAQIEEEFLNKLNPSGMPPHRLALKVGACIILIRNMSITEGHCNGTRYIIAEMTKNLLRARKLRGGPNSEILIPRIPTISKTSFIVPFKRLQFPVLGAYYLTFNRAQGQILRHAGMYLPQSVLSHGHLYVGASRCRDPDNIAIYADQSEFDYVRYLISDGTTVTRNVVYPEIFQQASIFD
ncbi:hypothetical protein ACHAWF_015721 [Thalassiosira exigua]